MELRPLRVSRELSVGEIDLANDDFRQTSPLKVEAQAELRQALEEIRIKGRLSVDLELVCDRCLVTYPWLIAEEFDLLYAPEDAEALPPEAGLNAEEAELAFYKGAGLELEDVLREQVLLAVPVKRVCREDCLGLCPVCGGNRNEQECNCQAEIVDPRWTGLKEIKLKE